MELVDEPEKSCDTKARDKLLMTDLLRKGLITSSKSKSTSIDLFTQQTISADQLLWRNLDLVGCDKDEPNLVNSSSRSIMGRPKVDYIMVKDNNIVVDGREWAVPKNKLVSDGAENRVYTHKPGAVLPCQQLHDVDGETRAPPSADHHHHGVGRDGPQGVFKIAKFREWLARIW